MAKCKICKTKFEPRYFLQKTCFNPSCMIEYKNKVIEDKKKKERKEWNKKKAIKKEALKTHSQHLNELQAIFNTFIRERDKNNTCISCNKPLNAKYDAGHYRSVGSCRELRFEEYNVYGQCVYCNQHLHGNLIEYRINLVKKLGVKKVEWLEGQHEIKKLTIEEINELKKLYKEKIKKLSC